MEQPSLAPKFPHFYPCAVFAALSSPAYSPTHPAYKQTAPARHDNGGHLQPYVQLPPQQQPEVVIAIAWLQVFSTGAHHQKPPVSFLYESLEPSLHTFTCFLILHHNMRQHIMIGDRYPWREFQFNSLIGILIHIRQRNLFGIHRS